MNNTVHGKTMENMRKRVKLRAIKNSQDLNIHQDLHFNTGLLLIDTDSLSYELHEKIHRKKCTSTKNYLI